MARGTEWVRAPCPTPVEEEEGQIALGKGCGVLEGAYRTQAAHNLASPSRMASSGARSLPLHPAWDVEHQAALTPGEEPQRPARLHVCTCASVSDLAYSLCAGVWSLVGCHALFPGPLVSTCVSEFQGRWQRGLGHVPWCASVLWGHGNNSSHCSSVCCKTH